MQPGNNPGSPNHIQYPVDSPRMKPRAAVILIENGKIAMIERHRAGMDYVVFPGGKVEAGESPEAAARREVKEELGLDIKIDKLVAEVWYMGTPQYYYLAQRVSGEFGTGTGKEMDSGRDSVKGSHQPVWISLSDLLVRPVLPYLVAEYVINSYPSGWPDKPLLVWEGPAKDAS
jgi:8-oxo-dGTP diphosphatase